MKKAARFIVIIFICVSFGMAQSRRVTQPENNQKKNTRPPATAAPSPAPQTEETDKTDISTEPQSNNTQPIGDEVITIETEVVTVPVRVLDRGGRFVGGLSEKNFTVFEDGVQQEISFFSNERQPFTVALVLDMSYSSTFKINEIQSAAIAFIDQLRQNDKVMVVSFDEEIKTFTEPTSDRSEIYRAIRSTKIASGTSLYDTIDFIINQKFKSIKGRKAIVLFTDGVDTTSRKASDMTNVSDAMELDALIYPIKYDTYADVQAIKNKPVMIPPTQPIPIPGRNPSPFPFPVPTGGVGMPDSRGTSAEDYRRAAEYLNDMANRTGGRLYEANTTSSLANAFLKIASELREFYSIGYYPKDDARTDKKRRRIKVKVDQKDLAVRAREDYVVRKKSK